ncbi:hypothetical protein [Calderihabitans maritimus]|uniref:Uncharacterized protein n=1 Tax=Calderihabitans maritimus TaxID=1246530 RepID=A0A1Z5HPS0_9FIRM|nr:hypothetical protein [Calderihabitans maritimus]GAW91321.1 hypothetical protein KKC1_04830 [Calderihabitans maritimus]
MKNKSILLRPLSFIKQIAKDIQNEEEKQKRWEEEFRKEWDKWGKPKEKV